MLTAIDRYSDLVPADQRFKLQQPIVRGLLADLNLYLGFTLPLHAGLTAWAALRLNRWWWFAISGPGFFVALFGTQLLVLP